MSGSIFGKLFSVTTWGESHGKGVGAVIDGCPSGVLITEEEIQKDLDRRKPGSSQFTTPRNERDNVSIMSGVFKGKTTGTPISLVILNENQRSEDYDAISDYYRPGHADYVYDFKYGFRDHRGGGRSSGRETSARVAAGAVARKILQELGIDITAYCIEIGKVAINRENFNKDEILKNSLCMPDEEAFKRASENVLSIRNEKDSVGGVVECVITGVMPGIGEPIFEKIDAVLSKAIMSIGGTKAIEFGIGIEASRLRGTENNDPFFMKNGKITKATNNSGGCLGGITDGDNIIFRTYFKPTSSIESPQQTVNKNGENITIEIKGRHDPLIAPRAVVVIEAMAALTLVDYIMQNTVTQIENIKKIYM